jgi:glyoxylate reductase
MPNIIITQKIPDLTEELLNAAGHTVTILSEDGPLPKEQLIQKITGAEAIISVLTDKIDFEVMQAAGSNLKIIANYAVGFDNIDLEAAKKLNIVVTNTPGVLTEAVAEHTIALILAVAKHINQADAFVRGGQYKHWLPLGFLGNQIWGQTIGIVGLGRIGSFLAEMCFYGFKMNITYFDVKRDERFEMDLKAEYRDLSSLLKEADIVSINVPLLPSTHHLISTKELELMKPSAILVNTSRGPVLDEAALVTALQNKKIAGAGLDVFEFEPALSPGLSDLDNVVLTPHTASATHEAREAMAKIAAQNVIAVLSGQSPLNSVL